MAMLGEILAPGAEQDPMQGYAPQPPKTPEELQQNIGLWAKFKQQMQDPNFKTAMLTTGINMLRSPGYGQSGFDVAANALGTGVQTLQGLRTAQQTRKDKLDQQTIENERAGKTTDAYVSSTATNSEVAKRNATVNEGELTENKRRNVEDEAIRRAQIAANLEGDKIRAGATRYAASAGVRDPSQQPADIQKINIMARLYKSRGIADAEADAMAVNFVQTAGKSGSVGDLAAKIYADTVKAYNDNPTNWRTPLTPEMQTKMKQSALEDAQLFFQGNQAASGTGAPPAAARPGAAPAVPTPPGSGLTNPGQPPALTTAAKVQMAAKRGWPPETIRQSIIEDGEDPAKYGY